MTPISDFYVLGGTLPRDAPSYAVRKADEDLLEGLRKGQFCYVLTSRQMGKSSLMVRTVTRLRQENVTCLVIDLTSTGQNLSEDQWYDGLLNCVAADLGLEDELDDFWQDNKRLGPLQRWMYALRSVVLTHVSGQIVIFVDEIDAVRSLPFSADEFFAGIRECYNRRTEDAQLNRLTFCLLGVATPADLIRDTRSTPFNIGMRIALTDFTEAEAAPLEEGLAARKDGETGRQADGEKRRLDEGETRGGREGESGRNRDGEKLLLNRVLYWTHGHPYLTQRLCSAVSESLAVQTPNAQRPTPDMVDRVCNDIFLSPGAQAQDDNLLFVRERILRADCDTTGLLMLYDRVRAGKRIQNSESDYQISVLRLSGVVRVENGFLCVRNRIYAQVFDRAWVKRNIPGVELRRQKAAFRRGAIGTALASACLVLLFIGGFMLTHYQKHLNMHVTLPDGTELIVNDVSYGKEVNYEPGAFRWSALFGRSPTKFTFREPTLSLWLSHYDPKTGKSDALTFGTIAAVDEHGHTFLSSSSGEDLVTSAMSRWLTKQNMTRIDFANFPKRNKTIHLQLFDWTNAGGIAVIKKEFDVPNPAPTLYPLWTPEPLPSTKTDHDLTVTLKSVNWSPPSRAVNNGVPFDSYKINPQYDCRERGKLTHPWQLLDSELMDATGNRSASQVTASCLCIYEPAWILRMRLARSDAAAFPPTDTWTLKGIAVPKNGCVGIAPGAGSVDGVTLNSVSVGVAPRVVYTPNAKPTASGTLPTKWDYDGGYSGGAGSIGNGSTDVNGSQPQVAVHVSGLKIDRRLTIWATDRYGHRYNQLWQYAAPPPGNANGTLLYLCFIPIPSNVHTVDLHFSILDIRTVEFMVRPPLPGISAENSK